MTITKKETIFFALFILAVVVPLSTFAFGETPFGGRITSIKTPPTVQCASNMNSPFMISPVKSSMGPWSATFGTVNVGQIMPNAWILGLMMFSSGDCFTTSYPPVYYPTTVTNFYGTSIGSF